MEDPTSMSAEELRAAIDDQRQRLEAEKARLRALMAETGRAREWRRLRREFYALNARLAIAASRNRNEITVQQPIDNDDLSEPESTGSQCGRATCDASRRRNRQFRRLGEKGRVSLENRRVFLGAMRARAVGA